MSASGHYGYIMYALYKILTGYSPTPIVRSSGGWGSTFPIVCHIHDLLQVTPLGSPETALWDRLVV